MSPLAPTAALVLFAAAPFADVLSVDAGGGPDVDFTDLPQAVLAASDGDLLLIAPGSYAAPEVAGKGISLHALPGGAVSLSGTLVVRDLAPGQVAIARGLEVAGDGGEGVRVEDSRGLVRLEGCTFVGRKSPGGPYDSVSHAGGRVVDSTGVALLGCEVEGEAGAGTYLPWEGAPGLVITGSTVAIYDCRVTGGRGGDQPQTTNYEGGDGGFGVDCASGSELFVGGSQLRGGGGGQGGYDFSLWDFVTYCAEGGDGGAGLRLADSRARAVDTALVGGAGGPGPSQVYCPGWKGDEGPEVDLGPGGLLADLPGDAAGLSVASPVAAGEPIALTVSGGGGEVVAVLASAEPTHRWDRALSGIDLVLRPTSRVVLAGIVPAAAPFSPSTGEAPAGSFEAELPPVALPPGVDSATLFLQAVVLLSDPSGVTQTLGAGPAPSVGPWLGSSTSAVVLASGE